MVVVPESVAGSPEEFHDVLVTEQVSVLTQTPSAVRVLSPEGLDSAALVVVGEACPAEVVDRWAPGRVMINAYRPDRDDDVCGDQCPADAAVLRGGADRFAGVGDGVVCAGWVVAAGAGGGWSVSCMWPVPGWRMGIGGGAGWPRRGLWRVRSGGPGRGCIAPGIWCVGAPTGSCGTSAALMSRSKSAATASNSAEIQAGLAALDGVDHAAVIAREDRPGDKRLVGYVTGTAEPAGIRAQTGRAAAGLHGAGRGGDGAGAAGDSQRQTRHPRPAGTRIPRISIGTGPRPTRSKNSWPAFTPGCWGWSGSGWTTRFSTWVGIRCWRCG